MALFNFGIKKEEKKIEILQRKMMQKNHLKIMNSIEEVIKIRLKIKNKKHLKDLFLKLFLKRVLILSPEYLSVIL